MPVFQSIQQNVFMFPAMPAAQEQTEVRGNPGEKTCRQPTALFSSHYPETLSSCDPIYQPLFLIHLLSQMHYRRLHKHSSYLKSEVFQFHPFGLIYNPVHRRTARAPSVAVMHLFPHSCLCFLNCVVK